MNNTAAAGYYTRDLQMPKSKAEGLQNFVQMVINAIEAGDSNSALLLAVDLLQDLQSKANPYREALENSEAGMLLATIQNDLKQKHAEELNRTHKAGYEQGKAAARLELMQKLGLAA